MVLTSFKYCLSSALLLVAVSVFSQESNQVVITIVGNAPDVSVYNDIGNSNPYVDPIREPQVQQQLSAQTNTIKPSLENGFHMRFEINSQYAIEPTIITGFSTTSASIGGGEMSSGKSKIHATTMAERSFNFKKKIRSKIPKRKKKYHPHLCGRF